MTKDNDDKKEVIKVKPLLIESKAYKKMMYYSKIMGTDEVGGMLVVDKDLENKRLIVEDVLLFRQVVSGASVILDKDKIHGFMTKLIKEGKEDLIPKISGWWHSHGNGGTF